MGGSGPTRRSSGSSTTGDGGSDDAGAAELDFHSRAGERLDRGAARIAQDDLRRSGFAVVVPAAARRRAVVRIANALEQGGRSVRRRELDVDLLEVRRTRRRVRDAVFAAERGRALDVLHGLQKL